MWRCNIHVCVTQKKSEIGSVTNQLFYNRKCSGVYNSTGILMVFAMTVRHEWQIITINGLHQCGMRMQMLYTADPIESAMDVCTWKLNEKLFSFRQELYERFLCHTDKKCDFLIPFLLSWSYTLNIILRIMSLVICVIMNGSNMEI